MYIVRYFCGSYELLLSLCFPLHRASIDKTPGANVGNTSSQAMQQSASSKKGRNSRSKNTKRASQGYGKQMPESKNTIRIQNTSQNPKEVPESKNTSRIQNTSQNPKTLPESKTHPTIQKHFQNPKHIPESKTQPRI